MEQNESPIQKIERIYGKSSNTVTLAESADYLRKIGYGSLADLLTGTEMTAHCTQAQGHQVDNLHPKQTKEER